MHNLKRKWEIERKYETLTKYFKYIKRKPNNYNPIIK